MRFDLSFELDRTTDGQAVSKKSSAMQAAAAAAAAPSSLRNNGGTQAAEGPATRATGILLRAGASSAWCCEAGA